MDTTHSIAADPLAAAIQSVEDALTALESEEQEHLAAAAAIRAQLDAGRTKLQALQMAVPETEEAKAARKTRSDKGDPRKPAVVAQAYLPTSATPADLVPPVPMSSQVPA